MKFRKKPVVIEAFQLTAENRGEHNDWPSWANDAWLDAVIRPHPGDLQSEHPSPVIIHTLEGDMEAMIGDYIIRGVKGEIYPCKPDIFAATYNVDGKFSVRAVPILGFFLRYWLLTLFTAFFVWLSVNDTVFPAFHYVGSMVYVTAIGSVMLWTTLFLRHVFFITTLDAYAASGGFKDDFNALPSSTKQLYAMIYFLGMLISFALVAQSVGK